MADHAPSSPLDHANFAGFWVRFFAAIVDLVVYTPLYAGMKYGFDAAVHHWLPATVAASATATDFVGSGSAPASPYQWWFEGLFVVVALLTYAWFFSSRIQASPGMYLLKFRITDTEGKRISYMHALWWGVTSMVGFMFCLGGVIYLMSRFDINAVNDITLSCLQQQIAMDDCKTEIENVIGVPYESYQKLSLSASLMAMFLLLIWALSIALPKDKSGFHNIFCRTRFVKGRA